MEKEKFNTKDLEEVVNKYNNIMEIIQDTGSHKGVLLSITLYTSLRDFLNLIKEQLGEDYYGTMLDISKQLKEQYLDTEEDTENE